MVTTIITPQLDIKKPKVRKRRKYNDKIFDNHFNSGDVEFVPFESKVVEIDHQYASARLDQCYNSQDFHRKELLNVMIDDIYKLSKWNFAYPGRKKIPKCEYSELFDFIRGYITDESYTEIEIFIEIADYLDLKYRNLYDMVSNAYKRTLLAELVTEFNMVKSKLKTHKLF